MPLRAPPPEGAGRETSTHQGRLRRGLSRDSPASALRALDPEVAAAAGARARR